MGVVNQPFCRLDGEGVWHGRGLWGLPIKSIVEIPPSDVKQKSESVNVGKYYRISMWQVIFNFSSF